MKKQINKNSNSVWKDTIYRIIRWETVFVGFAIVLFVIAIVLSVIIIAFVKYTFYTVEPSPHITSVQLDIGTYTITEQFSEGIEEPSFVIEKLDQDGNPMTGVVFEIIPLTGETYIYEVGTNNVDNAQEYFSINRNLTIIILAFIVYIIVYKIKKTLTFAKDNERYHDMLIDSNENYRPNENSVYYEKHGN